jgi:hypothetical protein
MAYLLVTRSLAFWDHDPQIAITLGTGALEVLGHRDY